MNRLGGLAIGVWGLFIVWVFGRLLISRMRGHRLPRDNPFVMLVIFAMGVLFAVFGLADAIK